MAQDGIVFTQGADGYVILKSQQAQTKIVFFDSDGAKYPRMVEKLAEDHSWLFVINRV